MNEYSFITFTDAINTRQIPLPVASMTDIAHYFNGTLSALNLYDKNKNVIAGLAAPATLVQETGYGYIAYSGDVPTGAKSQQCFFIGYNNGEKMVYSNPLFFDNDPNITTAHMHQLLIYYCNETQFGFPYASSGSTRPNKVRLPIRVYNPQFPQEEKIYVDGNGKRHLLTAKIDFESDLETEYLTEDLHKKLVVALSHDVVSIKGDQVNKSGGYEIAYEDEDTLSCGTKIHKAKAKMIRNITLKNTNC